MRDLSEARDAVVRYQFAERIKSHLIVSFKMVDYVESLQGDARIGAEGLLLTYLEAVMAEIRIAYNATRQECFLKIEAKLSEAADGIKENKPPKSRTHITEALTMTTTCATEPAEKLIELGLL